MFCSPVNLCVHVCVSVWVSNWVTIRGDSSWNCQVILSQMFINVFWKLSLKYRSMCVVFFVYGWVCVLIGIKGGKQFSNVHINIFPQKPTFIFADLNYFILCLHLHLPKVPHSFGSPKVKFPISGQFTYLKVLNWEIIFCVTDIWKFNEKDTHFSFQCSWIILLIVKKYIVTYSKPRPFSSVHHGNVSQN